MFLMKEELSFQARELPVPTFGTLKSPDLFKKLNVAGL